MCIPKYNLDIFFNYVEIYSRNLDLKKIFFFLLIIVEILEELEELTSL